MTGHMKTLGDAMLGPYQRVSYCTAHHLLQADSTSARHQFGLPPEETTNQATFERWAYKPTRSTTEPHSTRSNHNGMPYIATAMQPAPAD